MAKMNELVSSADLMPNSNNQVVRSKPRYSENENEMIYENWWNPKLRKELSRRFGRKISALRSQFCRILKEKGISNTDYYKMMRAKYQTATPKEILSDDEDQLILEIFAKHQVLGGTRNDACLELQRLMAKPISEAALKLRFYRLVQKRGLSEEKIISLGRDVLKRSGIIIPEAPLLNGREIPPVGTRSAEPVKEEIKGGRKEQKPQLEAAPADNQEKKPGFVHSITPESEEQKSTFLYQLAHLPETIKKLEERVNALEAAQRRQLDLRGFIEHLLAVERDLKQEEKFLAEIDRLVAENQRLTEQFEKERARLAKREKELTEIYELLNSTLNDFMHLESVAKLASLGDFIHRMEITVDQFGNVMKSRRIQGA
ncbi:MAG TPA: hypothetical protein GXX33_05050 [Firmicutes bacterium]|uniref:Uncharacterized protein n=1 Tax=Capillibacterium thermochitinicola TaxID=2699427 RepID=A0A8J6LJ19_9FIRM|nr:hypothetical protein [Capillibacterium thermochitinicola]MBA2133565.1 hypothetical protein [Capillibacterium thermochitinicola]HHW12353.1 hypothetical protein [Bacillota bacterium]